MKNLIIFFMALDALLAYVTVRVLPASPFGALVFVCTVLVGFLALTLLIDE